MECMRKSMHIYILFTYNIIMIIKYTFEKMYTYYYRLDKIKIM